MRTRTSVLFVLALALGVPAVATPAADDEPAEQATTLYYPLKVGNTWTYKGGDSTLTTTVAKIEEVDKQKCARIEVTSASGKVALFEDVAVKADGVYRYKVQGKKADPPVCFLKLPPKKDETWKVESSVADMGKLTGTFKSGEIDELKVGDKKYEKVITVSSDDLVAAGQKVTVTYYFAKDVGMVKQTLSVGGQQADLELEKFEAGK